jgi:hypothetical protein
MTLSNNWLKLAGISGASAVLLGAIGIYKNLID